MISSRGKINADTAPNKNQCCISKCNFNRNENDQPNKKTNNPKGIDTTGDNITK